LSGLKKNYLKLSFLTVQGLTQVRDELMPLVEKNRKSQQLAEVYLQEECVWCFFFLSSNFRQSFAFFPFTIGVEQLPTTPF
jgi:hypothetical protein